MLLQVACYAGLHLKVCKGSSDDGRIITHFRTLEQSSERVEEVADMLGEYKCLFQGFRCMVLSRLKKGLVRDFGQECRRKHVGLCFFRMSAFRFRLGGSFQDSMAHRLQLGSCWPFFKPER